MLFLYHMLEPYRSDIILKKIIILLYFKSQETEKGALFPKGLTIPQGTYNSQNSRNETLAIADHEYEKFSKLASLDTEL